MGEILRNLDWSVLTDALRNLVPAVICVTLHELCHGYAALLLGDDTAKRMGRLTWNPLRHIDIMGLIMIAIFRFGWAKPVPIDMRRFRNPKAGMALTALAGPVANVLLACVAFFLYGLLFPLLDTGDVGRFALSILYSTGYLSTALAVFNLLPIPPLDGSKVLFAFLPDRAYGWLMRNEKYGMLLLVLILISGVLSAPLSGATGFVVERLLRVSVWGYSITGSATARLLGGVAA